MANQYSFSVMPSVSISRSRFERKSQHKTSFNMGQIIPIYVDEVLPGDTRSMDLAALVRMSTPIAPIMDNIYLDYFAFFVPNRLCWNHWKELQGENNTSAGIPTNTYSVPSVNIAASTAVQVGSLADYFGIPVGTFANVFDKVSALPFRAYFLIYNRWFRNENIIAPLPVRNDDTYGALASDNYNYCFNPAYILKASKLPDYFTMGLPYAQKGAPVSIPLGTTAPIVGAASLHSVSTNGIVFGDNSTTPVALSSGQALGTGSNGSLYVEDGSSFSAATKVGSTNMVVDLSNATAATINQLRYAFQLQKLLEKDALYGTRYWEILAAHFGITAPDASLQDPEYLGGKRMNINVDQVLSTAGYDPSISTEVGQPGANSVSSFKGSLFTKSFTEHGHIIIVAVARHDQTYGQGLNRMWSRRTRYDFYMPVFANLGAQEIKKKEIYLQGTTADEELFAYQEAWAEYRYKPSICSALLNPNVTGGLKYWTLANRFASLPTLGQTFIEQGRDCIQDALVTGSTGPDFIGDFFFRDIAVRPMPVYSIPGLIDHH